MAEKQVNNKKRSHKAKRRYYQRGGLEWFFYGITGKDPNSYDKLIKMCDEHPVVTSTELINIIRDFQHNMTSTPIRGIVSTYLARGLNIAQRYNLKYNAKLYVIEVMKLLLKDFISSNSEISYDESTNTIKANSKRALYEAFINYMNAKKELL